MTNQLKKKDLWQAQLQRIVKRFNKFYKRALKFKDIEDLHQARVSLRQLLTILEFLEVSPLKEKNDTIVNVLFKKSKGIQKCLGKMRDYDVFIQKTNKLLKKDKVLKKHKNFRKATISILALERKVVRCESQKLLPNYLNDEYFSLWDKLINIELDNFLTKLNLENKFDRLQKKFFKLNNKYSRMVKKHGKTHPATIKALHKIRLESKHLRYAYQHLDFALKGKNKAKIIYYKGIQEDFGEINDFFNLQSLFKRLNSTYGYFDFGLSELLSFEITKMLEEQYEKIDISKKPPVESKPEVKEQQKEEIEIEKDQISEKPEQVVEEKVEVEVVLEKIETDTLNEEEIQAEPPKEKVLLGKIGIASADNKDDLQRIKGIGPKLESVLNSMGIFTFEQISKMDEEEYLLLDSMLTAFKGRAKRDDWAGQAKSFIELQK